MPVSLVVLVLGDATTAATKKQRCCGV